MAFVFASLTTSANADTYDHVAGVGTAFTGQEGVLGTADGPLGDATYYDVTGIATDGENLYATVTESSPVFPGQTPGPEFGAISESWVRKIDLGTGAVSTLYHQGSSGSGNYRAGPIVYHDNALYFLTYQGKMYYSEADGVTFDVDDPPRTTLEKLDLSDDTTSTLQQWARVDDRNLDAADGDGNYTEDVHYPPSSAGGLAVGDGYLYMVDEGCEQKASSTEPFASKILRLPLDGGDSSVFTTLSTGGNGKSYRACGELKIGDYQSGTLYVSNENSAADRLYSIYAVDTSTGDVTPVIDTTSAANVPHELWNSPTDLEMADGILFASFESVGHMWSIDPDTGNYFRDFAGAHGPEQQYQGQMGTGAQIFWDPGDVEHLGTTLYVADLVGDYSNGWGEPGYDHHVIRKVDILPDTAPPDGTPTGEPAAEPAAHEQSAASGYYKVNLNAIDKKSSWRASGVGYYRLSYGATTTSWRAYKPTVTVQLPAQSANVQFKDRANNLSPQRPIVFRPDTRITSGPSGTVTQRSAVFKFTSIPAGASFECRLDAAAYGPCVSGKTYTGLVRGTHTFRVRAKNRAGVDGTPASRTWTIK